MNSRTLSYSINIDLSFSKCKTFSALSTYIFKFLVTFSLQSVGDKVRAKVIVTASHNLQLLQATITAFFYNYIQKIS